MPKSISRPLLTGLSALTLSSVALTGAFAQTPDWADDADALLDTHWNEATSSVSVIVTRNGEVVYARAAGMADLDAGRPADTDTVYRLASITKQFASAIILQLVDEGQVALDAPLSAYLPDYREPGASATVRQLLNHTSGIRSYTNLPSFTENAGATADSGLTTSELIAIFDDEPLEFEPGDSWNYNNSGYVLLGAIIEAVTGQNWYEAVEERISEPLGLETLRYGGFEDQMPTMASGYSTDENGDIGPARRIHMSLPHAAGALISDAEDLAEWAEALHSGEVVSHALYSEMIAPTMLPDGTEVPYGYGLTPGDVRGRPTIGHSGGIFGFSTESLYLPGEDLFVAVLANSDQGPLSSGLVARRLVSYAIRDPYPSFSPVEVDLTELEPLYGVYAIEGTEDSRQFFARDGQLYTLRSGGSASEVYPVGDNRFYYGPDSLTWFEIVESEDGTPIMNMHQQGASEAEPALWSGPIPEGPATIDLPADTLASYVGSYALGGASLDIRMVDTGALEAQLTGQPAIAIAPISETEFLVTGVDARLVFTAGQPAPSVTLYQGGQEIVAERTAD